MSKWCISIAAAFALIVAAPVAADPFSIKDYFSLWRYPELALSPDGREIVFIASQKSGSRLAFIKRAGPPAREAVLDDARTLIWPSRSQKLYFTHSKDGRSFISKMDVNTSEIVKVAEDPFEISAVEISDDGLDVAYLSKRPKNEASLFYQLHHGTEPIDAQADRLHVLNFVSPNIEDTSEARLKVSCRQQPFRNVAVRGRPVDMHWSPDGGALLITYVPDSNRQQFLRDAFTSVGVFRCASRAFHTLLTGRQRTEDMEGEVYSALGWTPNGKIIVRRIIARSHWLYDWAAPDVAQFALSKADTLERKGVWHSVQDNFGRARVIFPFGAKNLDGAVLETRNGGLDGLYSLSGHPSKIFAGKIPRGGSHSFQFSADRLRAAFVSEALDRPPEIYLGGPKGVERVTALNATATSKVFPEVRSVRWTSTDGTAVSGWLLEPRRAPPPGGWPLLTMLHGGPAFQYPDAFAPYFDIWPYPLEVMAIDGIAVFVPNYRGTFGFGLKFASPKEIFGEPVDDVLTGIESLTATGRFDRSRLGLAGQSHGALLGPRILVKARSFRATSFANGFSGLAQFTLLDTSIDKELQEWFHGGSIYNDATPYIQDSPELHFAGLSTATLWEAGANDSAIGMISYHKAATLQKMPSRFIIYPDSGHNLADIGLELWSAELNLKWFRFWLAGCGRSDDVLAHLPSEPASSKFDPTDIGSCL